MTTKGTKLLSIGMNAKLGKKIGVFNLPQFYTCIGATDLCRQICYAGKAERMYATAKNKRRQNLQAAMGASFVADMQAEIVSNKLSMVRIHESGDFYDQKYADKWFDIIRALPNVQFLAYTKSWAVNASAVGSAPIDFSAAPKNLSLLMSTDSTSVGTPPAGYPIAFLQQKGEALPGQNYYTCIHKLIKHYCGTECKLCWHAKSNGKVNIYFPKH